MDSLISPSRRPAVARIDSLTPEQWSSVLHKHTDHYLTQFGV